MTPLTPEQKARQGAPHGDGMCSRSYRWLAGGAIREGKASRGCAASHSHALKVEALAGLGELLKKQPKAKESRGRGPGRGKGGAVVEPPFNEPPTLADMGIDKKTSSLAQRLASLSEVERNAVARRQHDRLN
uniref:Uncharacterized protein n=1 Tax=uncultured gamma proteobacterium HF4000_48E10 TaxID=723583 RepID=E7C8R3_9GAMM|nr:hypothetical protein [uncultured gamma proteobacterium HF4000_48E10]